MKEHLTEAIEKCAFRPKVIYLSGQSECIGNSINGIPIIYYHHLEKDIFLIKS